MIKKRIGVYETNSSSSHSLAISGSEFILDTLIPNEEGNIIVEGKGYGWDWFKLNTAKEKVSYIATSFQYNITGLDLLLEVIKEQTMCEDVIFKLNDGCYIDHESTGLIPVNKETLRDLIFNKNRWILGGNDNDYDPLDFNILVDAANPDKKIYNFEFRIEGFPQFNYKLASSPSEEQIFSHVESHVLNGMIPLEEYASNYSYHIKYVKNGYLYYTKGDSELQSLSKWDLDSMDLEGLEEELLFKKLKFEICSI